MSLSLLARRVRATALMSAIGLFAACGGGSSGGDPPAPEPVPVQPPAPAPVPVPPPDPVGPGELLEAAPLATIPVTEISAAVAAQGSRAQGLRPVYSVASYRLVYYTTDVDGRQVRASGLVSLPVKPAGARSPVLGYQHATTFRDAEAPSNAVLPTEAPIVLASLGFIVVASDYVGYGVSKGTPHPYLLAAPSAAAVVDFLTAARTWRRRAGVIDNGQLFLTGYSEGAYVTMAAHRAMQTSGSSHLNGLGMVVTGGGPYDVKGTMDGLLDLVRDEIPVVASLLDPGVLRFLGSSVRRQLRDALLRQLLPNDADVVFDVRFIDRYLADDWFTLAIDSDVHEWLPALPVRLFHGREDRTVPYASSEATLKAMQDRGAGDRVSLTDCTASPSSHLGCVPGYLNFLMTEVGRLVTDL